MRLLRAYLPHLTDLPRRLRPALEALEGRTLLDGVAASSAFDAAFGASGRAKIDVGGFGDDARAVFALPDGRVLVGFRTTFSVTVGGSGVIQPQSSTVLARLKPDGALDPTFGNNGITARPLIGSLPGGSAGDVLTTVIDGVTCISVQPDGKILVGAHTGMVGGWPATGDPPSTRIEGGSAVAVLRLTADGELDTSFGLNGLALANVRGGNATGAQEVRAIAVQGDGKIVAVGNAGRARDTDSSNPDFADWGVVRFNTDGAVDATFTPRVEDFPDWDGRASFDVAEAVAVAPDGKIVVGGRRGGREAGMAAGEFAVIRYNPDGTRDATFGTGGAARTAFPATENPSGTDSMTRTVGVTELALQPDGKIVAAGPLGDRHLALARYNPDGTLDSSFGGAGVTVVRGAENGHYALRVKSDGSLFAAGVGHGYEWKRTTGEGGAVSVELVKHLGLEAYAGTFNASGVLVSAGWGTRIDEAGVESLFAVDVAPDGKIVGAGVAYPTEYAGEGPGYAETADALVVRLDPAALPPAKPAALRFAALTMNAGGAMTPRAVTWGNVQSLDAGATPGATFHFVPASELFISNPGRTQFALDTAHRRIVTPLVNATMYGRTLIRGGRFYSFQIKFANEALVQQTPVTVSGPDNFAAAAQIVKVKPAPPRLRPMAPSVPIPPRGAVVSYRVAAPAGRFTEGAYTVRLNESATVAASGQLVGIFSVNTRRPRPAKPGASQPPTPIVNSSATGFLRITAGAIIGNATGWIVDRTDGGEAGAGRIVEIDAAKVAEQLAGFLHRHVTVAGTVQNQFRPGRGWVRVLVVDSITAAM